MAAQRQRVSVASAWLAVAAVLACLCVPVASRAAPSSFDHYSTGFELTGQHRDAACESCHVGGIFKGTPHDCFACHAAGARMGATAKPARHIISDNDCAQCHTPFGWKPVAMFDHVNVLGTCSSCHNNVQAVGKSRTHLATTAECSACHLVMQPWSAARAFPSNHIPYAAAATCAACHKSNDFSALPALTDIHANAQSTTGNCIQCHGSTAASYSIAANGFSIKAIPAGHITAADSACESCHVGANSSIKTLPVLDGAKFSGSAMSHAGLTTCVSCHGPTVGASTFAGITKIVVLPPTAPMGASAHVPYTTAADCGTCHTAPSALVPGNATAQAIGTTQFLTLHLPTTAQIHANIGAATCMSCHEHGYQWADTNQYPLAPGTLSGSSTTQYTGFQTRPTASASATSVTDNAHTTSGDCVTCHGTNFNYFSGQAEPGNHIQTTTNTCSVCHTTAGNYTVWSGDLTTLHANVPTTCSTCHADGKGPFAAAAGFTLVQMSTRGVHIPITNAGVPVECSGCHKSVTTFTGTIMSHAAIGDSANSAAGNACDACHEYGFRNTFYGVSIGFTRDSPNHKICGAAGTPTAPNITVCANGGSDCLTGCHQHNNIPSKYASVRPKTPQKQIQGAASPALPKTAAAAAASAATPHRAGIGLPATGAAALGVAGGKFDHAALAGGSCQSCHNGAMAGGKGPAHPLSNGACGDCHSTLAWQPVLRVDHADVLGTCASCHNGKLARAKPASHPLSGNDCDRCHTTSAWRPAAFDHGAVMAGTCATCHNALAATGKSAGHVATTLSCDACHYVLGWKPTKPARAQPPLIKKPSLPSLKPPRLPGAAPATTPF